MSIVDDFNIKTFGKTARDHGAVSPGGGMTSGSEAKHQYALAIRRRRDAAGCPSLKVPLSKHSGKPPETMLLHLQEVDSPYPSAWRTGMLLQFAASEMQQMSATNAIAFERRLKIRPRPSCIISKPR